MKIPESIERAIESGNETELKNICENLHPADAAAAFTALDENQQELFAKYLDNEALSLNHQFPACSRISRPRCRPRRKGSNYNFRKSSR